MNTCVRCDRPMPDNAVICRPEALSLAQSLQAAAGHAEDAETVISRQARYGGGSRGGSSEPLPVDLTAADRYSAAGNAITTWARHIDEHGGGELPANHAPIGPLCAVECGHLSCRAIRRAPAPIPLGQITRWVAEHLGWLRRRTEAQEAFDELHDACRTLERLVDRPADRELVGMCDCGKVIYTPRGAGMVTCPEPTCRLRWNVDESRAILRKALDGKLVTPGEAARLAQYLDGDRTQDQIRALISRWVRAGLLERHGYVIGPPGAKETELAERENREPKPEILATYRFGDVSDRLARTPRRERRTAA